MIYKIGVSIHDIHNDPKAILDCLITNNVTLADISNDINSRTFHKNDFEVNELLAMFCGKITRLIYEICIIFALFTCSWYYFGVFSISMTRFVGISTISENCEIESYSMSNFDNDCRSLYTFYVFLFYVWTMILTLFEFRAQVGIQVLSFSLQVFIVCGLIYVTCIGLMYGNLDYDADTGKYYQISNYKSGKAHYGKDVVAWDWDGIGYMLTIGMWCYTSAFAVPDLIDPLR